MLKMDFTKNNFKKWKKNWCAVAYVTKILQILEPIVAYFWPKFSKFLKNAVAYKQPGAVA